MKIAIVTGASSGMGKEFAKKIDSLKLDAIWGIALGEEELNKTKSELSTPFECFNLDLTHIESFKIIDEKLKNEKPEVEMLVNCSGFGKFGRYDEIPTDALLNMIDLNCKALVHLTQLILPYMPNKARIVQFGSVSAFQPVPWISVYGATKAFVVSYSRALNVELKPRKISVTCVCPFWTKTAFFKRAVNAENQVITHYSVMYDPQKVVNKAFKDSMNRKELSIYGFVASAQAKLVKILPHKLVMSIWCKQQKFKQKYENKK